MKHFNERIDNLVKFAIETKRLAVTIHNDMDLGAAIRKLTIEENEKTTKGSTKIS
jgi:hypothetical protein